MMRTFALTLTLLTSSAFGQYTRVETNGTNLSKRPTLNFGTGVACSDDSTNNSTDCSLESRPAARYKTSAGQSLPSATSTVVNFDAADYDTDSAVTTGASWHFTVPANRAGNFLVCAAIAIDFAAGASTCLFELDLFRNGVHVAELDRRFYTCTNIQGLTGCSIASTVAGDTLDIRAYQGDAVARSLTAAGSQYNTVSIQRLDSAAAAGTAAHNLLSATHLDTTGAGTEAMGDLLYRDGSGKWNRLAIGSSTQVLHGGTVPVWSNVDLANDVLATSILSTVNGGTGVSALAAFPPKKTNPLLPLCNAIRRTNCR